jgi:LytS/YehU family sensor histidine kinase
VLGLWAVSFVLFVSASFIDGFVYITPENQYYRGPLFPFLLIMIIAITLFNLAGTIKRRKRLSRKTFLASIFAILPITVALTVHLFIDVFPLIDVSYVLSALAMYSLILSDQIELDRRQQQEIVRQQQQNARQQREIAHERASVMVLQMRPHFVYNTLMSIHSLCRLDPQKAQQVTMDFTNYLRRNFNAVASDSAIPFSTELEHTRAYLAVEQAQYDDMLIVDYDTSYTRFCLPPLTLQPIVENAVKHGLDPDSEPLHISIRTQHSDSGTEIIVEDNGRGFAPADDGEKHFALKNIRQRLEIMCSGSLAITPGKDGGTVVTVTIPDNTAQ